MEKLWEPNEEMNEEEELVVTEHRDVTEPEIPSPDERTSMETTVPEGEEVLEEFGEDVSSSPAQRGTEVPPDTGDDPAGDDSAGDDSAVE